MFSQAGQRQSLINQIFCNLSSFLDGLMKLIVERKRAALVLTDVQPPLLRRRGKSNADVVSTIRSCVDDAGPILPGDTVCNESFDHFLSGKISLMERTTVPKRCLEGRNP